MFLRLIRFAMRKTFQQRPLNYVVANLRKEYKYRVKYKVFSPTIPFYFAGIWGFTKKKNEDNSRLTTRDIILAKADALFDQEDYKEIYKLLNNYKDDKDVEILWRLSRAMYKISKSISNDPEAKKLVYEAYELICQALSLQEDHWAVHKWVAILLNKKTSYEGTKIKIKELYNIKKHLLRASELNPGDATTLYMIGNWCYQLADLAWYQRKIASTIFTEPPTCPFEEALQYFEQAEDIDPNFYGDNLLMLGKTCLKLNKKDGALKYLKMASEYPAKNDDDQKAKQEALKLLNSL